MGLVAQGLGAVRALCVRTLLIRRSWTSASSAEPGGGAWGLRVVSVGVESLRSMWDWERAIGSGGE